MPNMSYCRFENTASDFRDCLYSLESEGIPASRRERESAQNLYDLSQQYIEEYEAALENEEDE